MKSLEILQKLFDYLRLNPERLNKEEIDDLWSAFDDMIHMKDEDKAIDDKLYDLFTYYDSKGYPNRHERIGKYIVSNYPDAKVIMDVGAGRMCHLSQYLANHNRKVIAIDPNIRLKQEEVSNIKLIKDNFTLRTDVDGIDLLVGEEPCDATERVIRRGLKEAVPVCITLWYTVHTPMYRFKKIDSPEAWHEHLFNVGSHIIGDRDGIKLLLEDNIISTSYISPAYQKKIK